MRRPWFRQSTWIALAGIGAAGCGAPAPETPPPPVEPVVAAAPAEPIETAPDDGLVEDDGRTLWASPTSGEPIDLSLVPSESGLFVHLRSRALLANEEGRRAWRALGPAGESATSAIEAAAGKPLAEVESLSLGVAAGESYEAVAADLQIEPTPSDDLPLIQRELEQLLETTDADRHLTVLFSPRFLLGDGGSLLNGPWEPLRDLLLAQLRDEWAAACLSAHLETDGRLYWELRVVASAAEPETRTAAGLAGQAVGWEADLTPVVDTGTWSAYSLAVVERSPAMLGVLGKYARRGTDGRQAIVNGYAPSGAAHSLLLAAERIVSELAAPPALEVAATSPPKPVTLAEALRRPVTISFRRESLETAVAILSDALGVPITIRGRDLQLEGITRNQMLALDAKDQPAGAALIEVLRRANPDTEATGAADPRQKLVVVRDGEGLAVTTRAAAERRGDKLPAAFRIKK